MKPIRSFIQNKLIKGVLKAEKPLYSISNGKICKNLFLSSVNPQKQETNVKIIKETNNSVFIAKINPDGSFDNSDFKILTTTDIHLDEDYDLNDKALKLFFEHVKKEKPDLIIFTGDVILSKFQHIDSVQFAQMMEKIGIYWAYVFGNHEAREEKEFFKYYILKNMTDYPHCLSKFGNSNLFGYGNFVINIMKSETELLQSLFLFDSGRHITKHHADNDNVPLEKRDGYDYIKPSQIKWYESEIKNLKNTYGEFKNILYMHIPIPEYKLALKLSENGEYLKDENGELLRNDDGSLPKNENTKFIYGNVYEAIGCSPYNSGLFKSMKQHNAQAIFSGHDHVNDFAISVEGILLVYSQCGGYTCYNLADYFRKDVPERYKRDVSEDEFPQGVTLTTINSNGEISLEQKFNRLLKF